VGDIYGALVRLIIFLPLVVLLAYLTIKFGLGKRILYGSPGSLRVVERLPLGARTCLYVVAVDNRYYLLGAGDGGVSLITELPDYRTGGGDQTPTFPWTGLSHWRPDRKGGDGRG